MKEYTPVIVESPYAGEVEKNMGYLAVCLKDCIVRGETPYASHWMLTTILDDKDPEERKIGIEAGLSMRQCIGRAVFYIDRGWSSGMLNAKEKYDEEQVPYEIRRLNP